MQKGGAILVMLNRQRELLHDRLEKVAKFHNNSELSDTVIDIMVGLKYPEVPEEVCEWVDIMDGIIGYGQPYFLYGNTENGKFHGVGMYYNGAWRSCEEDVP